MRILWWSRTLTLSGFLAVAAGALRADDFDTELWTKVLGNRGGIVITVYQARGQEIEIRGGAAVLDRVVWLSPDPFVVQYAVPVGGYTINLNGTKELTELPVKESALSFVMLAARDTIKPKLITSGVLVDKLTKEQFIDLSGSKDWRAFVNVKPIQPETTAISVFVRPPWEIPPPKPPMPVPNPSPPEK